MTIMDELWGDRDMIIELRLKRRLAILCAYGIWITVAMAVTEGLPTSSALDRLITGSAQTILALALVSVVSALLWTGKQLLNAHTERINALEAAVVERAGHAVEIAENVAAHAASINTLAGAVDRLREHCNEHRFLGPK
jgi:hypothetical protein